MRLRQGERPSGRKSRVTRLITLVRGQARHLVRFENQVSEYLTFEVRKIPIDTNALILVGGEIDVVRWHAHYCGANLCGGTCDLEEHGARTPVGQAPLRQVAAI